MQVSQVNLARLPAPMRQTVEDVLKPTSPNLYVTSIASQALTSGVPAQLAFLQTYQFAKAVKLASANVPIDKIFLLNPTTKLAFEGTGLLADFGGKVLDPGHPEMATILQGVSVFVGAYGCLEKMLKPEKYSRKRRVFCIGELAMSVLIFLGQFIPQLKDASTVLLGIKVVIKLGDKIEERNYTAREPQGRALLQAIQASSVFSGAAHGAAGGPAA